MTDLTTLTDQEIAERQMMAAAQLRTYADSFLAHLPAEKMVNLSAAYVEEAARRLRARGTCAQPPRTPRSPG